MSILNDLRALTPNQRNVVVATFLGWTLDAFDFFIIVFVFKDIAKEFNTDIPSVTATLFLTLAMRPVGAFLFGMLADRFGRRPTLMANILFYSIVEFLSGFAPSLTVLVILRGLYGIAMGGEWGVGASLTMETIPPQTRGIVSGLLQAGYPSGYLLAAVLYGTSYHFLGWRGMFMVGALPALLVLFIRRNVEESPAWKKYGHQPSRIFQTIKRRWGLFIYVIILMTAFNSFSHGTQDIYPTFLQVQQKFPAQTVSAIAIVYNIGAILGGIVFGTFSERIGRRRAVVIAALLTLPVIPLWAFSNSVVMLSLGAFLIQFFVQGAWGVIPVHLNELSPDSVRGTFPGFTYQLGNLFASKNGTIQTALAVSLGNNYGLALAVTAAIVASAVAIVTALGPEALGVKFGEER
ncbi:MAG TPA: MFS transporter [Chthoniobacterales bacterium]|jgi:SHS family lactate transporter-like MFS transporter|nr:MFS transporter [Chthoniobacterales bacterium]